jgi:hypothetical protein
MSWKKTPVRKVASGAIVLALFAATACEDFLEVQDPGRYTDDALNTPLALTAVANGVEGDFTSAFADLAWDFGQMSDELTHTGTWNPDNQLDRGQTPTLVNQGAGQPQGGFLGDRTASQKAQERFLTVMGDTASRSLLMARVVAVEGWANLALGMYNCESPTEPNGPIVSDIEMFQLAIPLLTEAASIANGAGSSRYENFAIAGRARANLLAGNLDAALADAQRIPDDFVFAAPYSAAAGTPSNTLAQFAHRSQLKAAGLEQLHWSKIDTIAGFMRDPWTGELDQRVPVTHLPNERGADGVTQFYNQEKYPNLEDDIPMTHGMEMRLIEAEVYMKKNDFVRAMERINYVRAKAGLDPVTATTQAEVQEKLLHERFAQLFLEGQRMLDLHRFGLVDDLYGAGRPTKFPLTSNEIQLNTNVAGRLEGRCMPTS